MSSWLVKYCPQKINDLLGQESIKRALNTIISSKGNDMPHLLFYGPPGSGKTLVIKLLTQNMYGSALTSNVLYIRSINELGIATIRKDIKYFSQRSVSSTKSGAVIKLVVIEGADSMTSTAQAALRRIIETQSNITRFCLTCTDITRIIDPIQSRCVIFRFKSIKRAMLNKHLRYICEQEQAKQTYVDKILSECQGDVRQSIMQLEVYHRASLQTNDTDNFVRWFKHNIITASYQDIDIQVKNLFDAALSPKQLLTNILQWLISQDLNPSTIETICYNASLVDEQIHQDGCNPLYLQRFLFGCKQLLLADKKEYTECDNETAPAQ